MSTWILRRAEPDDADGLASCLDAAYARYEGRIADLPQMSEDCAGEIAGKQVWLAMLDDQIVGALVLTTGDGFMKLANLAVRPEHNGKGIGRALIALSESEAAKQGFGEMRLNTHIAMPENVRLYSRLGWREMSTDGNTVMMEKRLFADPDQCASCSDERD